MDALVIGMLPVVYAVSAGRLGPMELNQHQVEETFLTAAQSLFAVAILANLSFSLMEAIVIFLLFATRLLVPDPAFRYYYSIFYVGLAVVLVAGRRILGTVSSDYFLAPPRKHWRSAETIGLQVTNVCGTKLSREVGVPDEMNHGNESNRHR
jgi:cation:H+ antiporter